MPKGIKRGQMVQFSGSYPAAAWEKFERLHAVTRIPMRDFLREAMDDLLKKYEAKIDPPKPARARRRRTSQESSGG